MENHGAVSETKCTFDVFLSFRGEDTRHTFTCKLYDALWLKGIDTFMDNKELKNGDKIGPTLHKAIEEARISVVVLSENYADSSWCLDELVKIHECMESKNQLVWPIFYKVNPSDVRHQKGSYGVAMTKHETSPGIDLEKVHKWRSTLNEIANLKGKYLEEGRDESKFIDDLATDIFKIVSSKDLSREMFIVGREYRVKELKLLLDLESRDITCLLGIHGTGGIGKTTLAKALYDSIYKQFDGTSFLNVGETSNPKTDLKHLQEKLLSEILEDDKIHWRNIEEGTAKIERRLGFKRVLIVLDNVDDIKQLNNLAGKCAWFGPGSRIIITTRDKHLLDLGEVEKRYEVKMLDEKESLELFCHYAFRKSCPESNYKDLSNRAMSCCKGLPLALEVLGSHLFKKNVDVWKDALDRYEKSPHGNVQKVLRISYDSLFRHEKSIFLDVACFFKGQRLDYVKTVLDASDFSSGDGITTLVNKSLLTVDYDCLWMHDLIQDMGREIVKEKAYNKIGERSRLWHHEDVLQVLEDDNGSSEIEGIMLDPPHRKEINCIDTVFEKMKNLRILIVRNTSFSHEPRYLPKNLRLLDWKNYPSKSLPSEFNPTKISAFNGSPQLLLEKPFQVKKEKNELEVMMPKREIPKWFHYVNKGRFPDFKARGKFPAVAIAFVFGEVNAIDKANRSINVGIHLLIEDERRKFRNVPVPENHVFLCDLRGLFSLEEWEDVGVGVGNDWKTIQVYCDTKLPLCSWGVYVYKSESNMKYIQFPSNDPCSSF
uniref:ADP-ribosyl cyclase/cyclic ADP-ribose hydrolase n=1 Tax=Glycine max TaxID=3847 RepID=K7N1C8_SOYBN